MKVVSATGSFCRMFGVTQQRTQGHLLYDREVLLLNAVVHRGGEKVKKRILLSIED